MTEPQTRGGRHRAEPASRRPPLLAGLAVLAVLAVLVLLGFGIRALLGPEDSAQAGPGDEGADSQTQAAPDPECAEPTPLTVAADPSIATVVAELLEDVACVDARVVAQASDVTAADAARPAGVGLSDDLPELWVPTSTIWVEQARGAEAGAARIVADPVSLASTPVVLAGSSQTAEALGWAEAPPRWSELARSTQVRVATTDPRSDGAALVSLVVATDGSPSTEEVARLGSTMAVPATLGRSPAQLVLADVADVIPTTELDILRAQEAGGDGALVAGYDPALGVLDYPLVAFTQDDEEVAAAAERVRERLQGEEASAAWRAHGLRDTSGAVDERYTEGYGIDPEARPAAEPPTREVVEGALDAWALAGRRVRVLLVIDRSGSMITPLAGGTVAKATLARDSVARLVASGAPDSDIGLWTFTTDGDTATVERLAAPAPLSAQATGATQRDLLQRSVAGVTPVSGGDTPLYQVILDAYAEVQRNYSYGRLNAVVVVTDGRNDHPSGTLTEEQTLDQLRLLYDGIRPVRILALGYGEETDLQVLTRIADVTGGRAYQGLTEADAATLLERTLAEL